MDRQFQGKKAVVIGGTGGLGRPLTVRLIEAGAQVVAIGRSGNSIDGCETVTLDIDNPENLAILLKRVCSADILCLVTGPFLQKPLHETGFEEWERMARMNLALPGSLVSSALPHMMGKKWGRILLFGGTRTDRIRGFKTNAAYAAAKTGLSSLVRSVAEQYSALGITCNAVCPGLCETEYLSEGFKKELSGKNPDGHLISSEEIADSALFLLKTASCNGVLLPMDKAWSPVLI